MNVVYYIATLCGNKGSNVAFCGGHGYIYDATVEGRKKVAKNVPTQFGYFVESEHQNDSVVIDSYLTTRGGGYKDEAEAVRVHLEGLFKWVTEHDIQKALVVTNTPNVVDALITSGKDTAFAHLYQTVKSRIIFNHLLYPKGGNGVKHALNQAKLASRLYELKSDPYLTLTQETEKEFSNPTVDFNAIVDGTHWYFTTGGDGLSAQEERLPGEKPHPYYFGRCEPRKQYYGKATPDATYSAYYSQTPLQLLDAIYTHCQTIKENVHYHLIAGKLSVIRSKEIARAINNLPNEFDGNRLMSPMKIGSEEDPCIVEYLNPPGLSYRIVEKIDEMDALYRFFLKREVREDGVEFYGKTHFVDITDYFFTMVKGKLKLSVAFSTNTLKFVIPVTSPDCEDKVKIHLSIHYDCPGRDEFNSIVKNKYSEAKVYLVLDFSSPGGVGYSTLITDRI